MDFDYTGLSLSAKRDEAAGLWLFGVELDGAWVVLYARKLGGIDGDIQRAKDAAAAAPPPPLTEPLTPAQ